MQRDDEKEIQKHVQNARNGERRERDLGIADAAEDGRFEVIEQDDRHSEQVDAQIRECIGKHIVRHVEHAQQRRGDELPEQRDHRTAEHGENDRRVDRVPDRLFIPAADGGGDDDVRAQRNADEKIDNEADDGTVCAHGCNGQRARVAGEVADDGDIRGVKELLQDRRGSHRQRKERQLVPDGAVEHIDLVFFYFCHEKKAPPL